MLWSYFARTRVRLHCCAHRPAPGLGPARNPDKKRLRYRMTIPQVDRSVHAAGIANETVSARDVLEESPGRPPHRLQ